MKVNQSCDLKISWGNFGDAHRAYLDEQPWHYHDDNPAVWLTKGSSE
jgi:hypothetical protein